jgi:hypothetical protein
MNATSSAILNAGVNGIANLFTQLLTYAITNWIPVVIAIVVVVGIIGFLYAKGKAMFTGAGNK